MPEILPQPGQANWGGILNADITDLDNRLVTLETGLPAETAGRVQADADMLATAQSYADDTAENQAQNYAGTFGRAVQLTATTATTTIDMTASQRYFVVTLATSTTAFTFANPPTDSGGNLLTTQVFIEAVQDSAGGRTWSIAADAGTTQLWAGGTFPTGLSSTPGSSDLLRVLSSDGFTTRKCRVVEPNLKQLAATPTVPGLPTGLDGTPGAAQVALTWTAPADNGGSPLTDYSIQYSTDPTFLTGVTTTTVGGTGTTKTIGPTSPVLTNGTAYAFRVAAVNAIGTGPYTLGIVRTPVASATAPAAPTVSTSVTYGNRSITGTVVFGSNGGAALTSSTVTATPTGTILSGAVTATTSASTTTGAFNFSGLVKGQTYNLTATATNSAGTSTASATVAVQAQGTPYAPTLVSATPGNAQVVLTWTQGTNAGTPLTGQTVIINQHTAGGTQTTVPVSGAATTATISPLTADTWYFTVQATDAWGNTSSNQLSAVVTVTTAPDVLDSLAVRYSFEHTVSATVITDESPNALVGVPVGYGGLAPGTTAGPDGTGHAMTFTRTSGQVFTVGNATPLDISPSLTIAGWCNITEDDTPDKNWELAERFGSYWLNMRSSVDGNVLRFGMNTAAGQLNANRYQCDSTNPVPRHQWVHVAGVLDSSTSPATMKVYINGSLENTQTSDPQTGPIPQTGPYASGNPLVVGGHYGGNGTTQPLANFMQGQLDEVRVYHRALTDAEIAQVYSATGGTTPVTLKPYLTGALWRHADPPAVYIPSGSAPAVPSCVIECSWGGDNRKHGNSPILEPTQGTYDWNSLSSFITTTINKWPVGQRPQRLSVRFFAGVNAPSWVRSLAGGPCHWIRQGADLLIPVFWSAAYIAAAQSLIDFFAPHIEADDRIADFQFFSQGGEFSPEWTIRPWSADGQSGNFNIPNAVALGYTEALDRSLIRSMMTYHNQAFPRTRIKQWESVAKRSLKDGTVTGVPRQVNSAGNPVDYQDQAWTDDTISWIRSQWGAKWLCGQNDVDNIAHCNSENTAGGTYYGGRHILQPASLTSPAHLPLGDQTQVLGKGGTILSEALTWIETNGGHFCELPSGSDTAGDVQTYALMKPHSDALAANAPAV